MCIRDRCTSTHVGEFSQYAKTNFPTRFKDMPVVAEEMILIFQWTINTDDTFELSGLSRHFKWSDGAVTRSTAGNQNLLKQVYDNVIEYDVARLKNPNGLDHAIIRMGDLNLFRMNGAVVSPPTKPVAKAPSAPVADPKASDEKGENEGD